jgi:hypothetical protein
VVEVGLAKERSEVVCGMGKVKDISLSNSHSLVQSTNIVGQNNHPFVFLSHDA